MSFPLLYQAQHQYYKDDLEFWIDRAAHSPGHVLEAGCGSGRVFIPLLKAGIKCVGIDLDFGMLMLLKQTLPKINNSKVLLLQADFSNFRLEAKFSQILMPCNTYTTLPKLQRIRTIEGFRKHLRPGGKFIFSAPNPEVVRKLPRRASAQIEDVFLHPIDREPVQVSSEWERDHTMLKLTWHYDHLHPDGTVDRLSIQNIQYLTSSAELIEELHAAGFQVDHSWGDFDYSDFAPVSPHFILQASC